MTEQGPSADTRLESGTSARLNIARQRRFWNQRAASWDHGAGQNPGLVKIVHSVLEQSDPTMEDEAIDLGCGSGQLTLAIAPRVGHVLAVDVSQTMIDLLLKNAAQIGAKNIDGRAIPIEELDIVPSSIDLVVSNYVLHHLLDEDKAKCVRSAYEWLKPGGKLVVGDMMLGRGGESRDRQIIRSKIMILAKKGPAGWWRIIKNLARYLLRIQERPISMQAWVGLFNDAGFVNVIATQVVNEAAVVKGSKPAL